MGAVHGIYCAGCCWGLMIILFVMGVMHLGWMAAIGALILLEKVAPSRKWIRYAIGTVFVIVGTIVMLFPNVLSGLSSYVLL
jgi:predicted metal-binding membrane protein